MRKGIWDSKPPATEEAIQKLLVDSGLDLPSAYLDYLRVSNGGEGSLGVRPLWLCLWPADEVIEANKDCEVQEYAPNFFGFGSSGGGEMLAFRIKKPNEWSVYRIPFIGMEEDAIMVAKDFEEFSNAIGQEFEEDVKS